jgi:hypothetical protein
MMDADTRSQRALRSAVQQLLRPLCRLLLRHAVSFGAFEELARRVYVDVALKEFGIPGKRPTASRVAVLTGLTRKEVHRLLVTPADDETDDAERYNRAAQVLTGWTRDAEFLDEKGEPRILEVDGSAGFGMLVKRYSGDMPMRAILDELVRVGAVDQREDGRLQLAARGFVPRHSAVDKLGILGRDVADLVSTIDHNLQHGETDPRFQRKVMYSAIPRSALPAFRRLSGRQAQSLLERLDRWLARHDPEDLPENPAETHARVGVGIYYIEEPIEAPAAREERP